MQAEALDPHDRKIMDRLHEHLDAVIASGHEWVGIFLQGSQNYGLDYEGSDIDTKAILLPSFEDFVLNRQPVSTTHVMENDEHCDFKDIRLMFQCFKKQNINFVEILFTKYRILNPKYQDLFEPVLESRERIARYNPYAALSCMVGMGFEKQKAMEHPYPATKDKIERFGYDPKQTHHAVRLVEFMSKYIAGSKYEDCLVSSQKESLKDIKRGIYSLDTARILMVNAVNRLEDMRTKYMETTPPHVDKGVEAILNDATVSIMKRRFLDEIKES